MSVVKLGLPLPTMCQWNGMPCVFSTIMSGRTSVMTWSINSQYQQVFQKRIDTRVMRVLLLTSQIQWSDLRSVSGEQAYPDWVLHSCLWSQESHCCSLDCSQCQNPQTAVAACVSRAHEASTYTRCYWGKCLDSSERPTCQTLCPALYVHSHYLKQWIKKKGGCDGKMRTVHRVNPTTGHV